MPSNDDDDIKEHYMDGLFSILDESQLFDCCLNLPDINMPNKSPLNYKAWIRQQQQADAALLAHVQKNNKRYITKKFKDDIDILCHVKPGDDPV